MEREKIQILVIECSPELDWYEQFKGTELSDGRVIEVFQAEWDDISCVSYHDSGLVVHIRPSKKPLPRTNQNQIRNCVPKHILMRSVSRGTYGQDSTNKLLTLLHAGVSATNSIFACHCFLEKPLVWAELR